MSELYIFLYSLFKQVVEWFAFETFALKTLKLFASPEHITHNNG